MTLEPAFVWDRDFPREPKLDAVCFRFPMTDWAAFILLEAPFAYLRVERDDLRFLALE